MSLVLLPPFPKLAHGLDNGLAFTPPQGDLPLLLSMRVAAARENLRRPLFIRHLRLAALFPCGCSGWRSWNAYTCQDSTNNTFTGGDIISDAAMRTAMHAVLDKSRSVHGVSTTLASLGYDYISMDDGWQQCNCSTHQDIDPTLPACSIGDCRGGRCSWHEKPSGTPMVNKHRFPSGMKSLVDYGHSLGLKVGSYLNNCICMDKDPDPKYEQDVAWFTAAGFDEVLRLACLIPSVAPDPPPRLTRLTVAAGEDRQLWK